MADINSITNASNYRGNPAAGGELAVSLTLDPSPLQRLAAFTFYADRDKWEKKVKDDAVAADRIAAVTAFDINSPLKPYTEDLKRGADELKQFLKNRPSALHYDKDPEGFQKYSEMYGELQIKRKRATVNDTLYNAQKAALEKLPASPDRDRQLKLLDLSVDELFEEGVDSAYGKQIRSSPELKPEDYKVPQIPETEIYTITRNPNDTVIEGKAYADLDRLDALATGTYLGLTQSRLDVNSPEFKSLSKKEQERAILESGITDKKVQALDNTAKNINALVQEAKSKFVDANGQPIPLENVSEDELVKVGGSIASYITSVKKLNKQIDEVNAATGKKYAHINLDDGASPEELLKIEFLNKQGQLFKELKPTIQENDNAIQLEKIRADKALGWAGLNWDKEKFNLQTRGSEEVKNGATIFAERMYNELKSLADENGVIPPDKLRALTTEQLKYLGYDREEVDESGKIIKGLKPLAIIPQNREGTVESPDAIQLENGQIKILKNAKKSPNSNRWVGEWDQTRTTTVSNIATNRLNEQLSKAGSKELNSYLPLDQGNIEVQSTTSGGGSTTSGSSSTGGSAPANYYYDANNVQSQKGEVITYKNGTVWKLSGDKMTQIK